LIPALFVIFVILGGILALVIPTLVASPYLAGLGVYTSVVAVFSVCITIEERSLSLLPWLPMVFVAIHVGAGTGILMEALAIRKSEPITEGGS
jgi:hypothetical protein